tara:strand:- start:536 stop:730 length:195 start_codon:yes stop_codon:yes gene_type:complete
MGKGRNNPEEAKMVGTVSNRIQSMSEKDRIKRKLHRLNQMTENEKKIMAKYGKSWDTIVRETYR